MSRVNLNQVRLTFMVNGVERTWGAKGNKAPDEVLQYLLDELKAYMPVGQRIIPKCCEVTEYVPVSVIEVKARRYTVNLTHGANYGQRTNH